MNKKFIKKIFFLSSIIAPIAISTPLILTSCSNSSAETTPQPSSDNQISILNSFSTGSNERLKKAISNSTLSLETTVHVKKGETVDKVIQSIKDDRNNLIKILSYSDAIRSGFNSGTDKIVNFSDISISSFVSSDLDISTAKVDGQTNKLTVTLTIKKDANKTWNIKDLTTIKFDLTVNAINSDLFKSVTFFTNLEEAKKLVPTDANNGAGEVVLSANLNGKYKIDENADDLQTISHKSLDELKKWLNGTQETTSTNLSPDTFLDIFYDGVIETVLTNKTTPTPAKEQTSTNDVVIKKESMVPQIITNENVTATFDITESDSGSTVNFQGREINTKIRNIKIKLALKNGYSWTGLSETAKTKNIVLNFSIPAPVLEEITLFTEWDENSFTLNDDAFVFENKLDENYEEFSWKNKDDVLNWFKQTETPKELSTVAESDGTVALNKQKFVGLFFNKILLNDDFKFVPKVPSSGKEAAAATTSLPKSSFLIHEISDKGVDAKVKVTDIPPKVSGYAADNTIGNQKKVEITLTPKPGYGWNLIQNTTNRTKPIKFILNIDASDATLPINALLGAVKTYHSADKGPLANIYWFKCDSNNNNQFDYSKAKKSIQDLVSNSIFAGPSQDAKTKKASEIYASDFKIHSWENSGESEAKKTKKLSYLKQGFDLSVEKNFNLFKELVIDQNFSNVYKEDNKDKTDIYVAGGSLWFSEYNDALKKQLQEQIKCDLMVSTAEASNATAKANEEITYTVSFRLTPKNGGNWKGRDNNYPIDIDVIFNVNNFASIMNNKTVNDGASQGKAVTEPNVINNEITFNGELNTSIFGDSYNADNFQSADQIKEYFKKTQAGSGKSKLTKAAAELTNNDIDFSKINKINKETIKTAELVNNSQDNAENKAFKIKKEELSFLYLDEKAKPNANAANFDKKIFDVEKLTVDTTKNSAEVDKKFDITLTLKLKDPTKNGWFWGDWKEVAPNPANKNKPSWKSNIKLVLQVVTKKA